MNDFDGGAVTQRYHGVHDGKLIIETIGKSDAALRAVRAARDMGYDRNPMDKDMELRPLYVIPPVIWHKLAKESGLPFHAQSEIDEYIHNKIMRDGEYSAFRVWERG